MKVLITGATGYVGRHLIKELARTPHDVYAIVRSERNNEILKQNGIKPLLADISNKESLFRLEKKIDVIVHLAFSLFPGADAKTNIDGFDNIVAFAKHNPLSKFIYVSSQLVYGHTPEDKLINEAHACNTAMTFGKQQLRAENILLHMWREEKFPAVILRPSEIYGGKGGFFKEVQFNGYINGKVPIIGRGNNAISFTYVGDLIQVIIRSVTQSKIEGQIFNVNTPGVLSLNELIKLIKSKTKTKPVIKVPVFMGWIVASVAMLLSKITFKKPFMDYDVVRVATMESGERSIQKAVELLDFRPKYSSIRDGLVDCYFTSVK